VGTAQELLSSKYEALSSNPSIPPPKKIMIHSYHINIVTERVKESKYGLWSLYECMEIEQWNLFEFFFKNGGKGGWGRIMEGVNLVKINCKHICKCHSEPPHTTKMLLKNTNIKHKKKKNDGSV
jgi:hypothetical protein